MLLSFRVDSVPLATDAGGIVRVSGTRVTLETVISAFGSGTTPVEIVESFPTLPLADVDAVIAYYLHHRDEVDAYLRCADAEADAVRREVESRCPSSGLRERMIARRTGPQSGGNTVDEGSS